MKQRQSKISADRKVKLQEALERLVQFYTDWGQPGKAADWQKTLDEFKTTETSAAARK